MAVVRLPINAVAEIDTVAKTVTVVLQTPAADGEGDVTLFTQNVTARLTADDRRKLRHLIDSAD